MLFFDLKRRLDNSLHRLVFMSKKTAKNDPQAPADQEYRSRIDCGYSKVFLCVAWENLTNSFAIFKRLECLTEW